MHKLYDFIESVASAVLLITVCTLFFFRVIVVDGDSMQNTINIQEKIISSNFLFNAEKGDIVVTDSNNGYGKPLIKRVIAIGGDEIKIDYSTGEVYVNGNQLVEGYIYEKIAPIPADNIEMKVPEGYVFLMGDNRNHSFDSRAEEIGVINENNLLGKAVFRISPLSKIGKVQ